MDKTIEQLAEDYADRNTSAEVNADWNALYDAFMAGYETAKEAK